LALQFVRDYRLHYDGNDGAVCVILNIENPSRAEFCRYFANSEKFAG
jgi:hypothetical protein